MPTLEYVIAVIKASVGREETASLTENSDLLLEVDIDSLAMLEIIDNIDRHFGVSLMSRATDFDAISTPGRIARLVEKAVAERGSCDA